MRLTPAELRSLSLRLERETGCDSIPTIERVYDRTLRGAYECSFPTCKVTRRDPTLMWEHVHFGPHGRPFGVDSPEAAKVERRDQAE